MNNIISLLERITSRGYSRSKVFSDWIDLMIYAFLCNDEEYLKVVRSYKNDRKIGEREIDFFTDAFAKLLLLMVDTNIVFLGVIYMTWNISQGDKGQFFTPQHITDFMATVLGNKAGNIFDPSCGSGVMLIAHAKQLTNDELNQTIFYGQDIDYMCVRICALNCLFFNVNAYIIYGDTLANEVKMVFKTTRGYLGGTIHRLEDQQVVDFKNKYFPRHISEVNYGKKQLQMF